MGGLVSRNGRVTPLNIPGYSIGLNGGQIFYVDSGGSRDGYTPGSLGFCQNFGCATNGSGLLTPAAGS